MQILAALTDDSVRVWDAWSGQLLQRLEGHAGRAHVLECHPLDHRLAMSAGYDGLTIIWDIIAGRALTRSASYTLFEAFGKSTASRSW